MIEGDWINCAVLVDVIPFFIQEAIDVDDYALTLDLSSPQRVLLYVLGWMIDTSIQALKDANVGASNVAVSGTAFDLVTPMTTESLHEPYSSQPNSLPSRLTSKHSSHFLQTVTLANSYFASMAPPQCGDSSAYQAAELLSGSLSRDWIRCVCWWLSVSLDDDSKVKFGCFEGCVSLAVAVGSASAHHMKMLLRYSQSVLQTAKDNPTSNFAQSFAQAASASVFGFSSANSSPKHGSSSSPKPENQWSFTADHANVANHVDRDPLASRRSRPSRFSASLSSLPSASASEFRWIISALKEEVIELTHPSYGPLLGFLRASSRECRQHFALRVSVLEFLADTFRFLHAVDPTSTEFRISSEESYLFFHFKSFLQLYSLHSITQTAKSFSNTPSQNGSNFQPAGNLDANGNDHFSQQNDKNDKKSKKKSNKKSEKKNNNNNSSSSAAENSIDKKTRVKTATFGSKNKSNKNNIQTSNLPHLLTAPLHTRIAVLMEKNLDILSVIATDRPIALSDKFDQCGVVPFLVKELADTDIIEAETDSSVVTARRRSSFGRTIGSNNGTIEVPNSKEVTPLLASKNITIISDDKSKTIESHHQHNQLYRQQQQQQQHQQQQVPSLLSLPNIHQNEVKKTEYSGFQLPQRANDGNYEINHDNQHTDRVESDVETTDPEADPEDEFAGFNDMDLREPESPTQTEATFGTLGEVDSLYYGTLGTGGSITETNGSIGTAIQTVDSLPASQVSTHSSSSNPGSQSMSLIPDMSGTSLRLKPHSNSLSSVTSRSATATGTASSGVGLKLDLSRLSHRGSTRKLLSPKTAASVASIESSGSIITEEKAIAEVIALLEIFATEEGTGSDLLVRYPSLHVSVAKLLLLLLVEPSGHGMDSHFVQEFPLRDSANSNNIWVLREHFSERSHLPIVLKLQSTLAAGVSRRHHLAASRLLKLLCPFLLEHRNYRTVRHLARGAYGTVLQVQGPYAPDVKGGVLAVKRISTPTDPHARIPIVKLFHEITALWRFRGNPSINRLIDFGCTNDSVWLMLEHCSLSVKQWRELQQTDSLLYPHVLLIFINVCYVVSFLHENDVIHYDLKADNVLLKQIRGDTAQVVLGDFGETFHQQQKSSHYNNVRPKSSNHSRILSRDSKTDTPMTIETGASGRSSSMSSAAAQQTVNRGTEFIRSPEMLRGEPTNKSSDIWSLGCLFFEMLTDTLLFMEDEWPRFFARVTSENPLHDMTLLNLLDQHPGALDLLKFILVANPKQRPTAVQVAEKTQELLTSLTQLHHRQELPQQQQYTMDSTITTTNTNNTTTISHIHDGDDEDQIDNGSNDGNTNNNNNNDDDDDSNDDGEDTSPNEPRTVDTIKSMTRNSLSPVDVDELSHQFATTGSYSPKQQSMTSERMKESKQHEHENDDHSHPHPRNSFIIDSTNYDGNDDDVNISNSAESDNCHNGDNSIRQSSVEGEELLSSSSVSMSMSTSTSSIPFIAPPDHWQTLYLTGFAHTLATVSAQRSRKAEPFTDLSLSRSSDSVGERLSELDQMRFPSFASHRSSMAIADDTMSECASLGQRFGPVSSVISVEEPVRIEDGLWLGIVESLDPNVLKRHSIDSVLVCCPHAFTRPVEGACVDCSSQAPSAYISTGGCRSLRGTCLACSRALGASSLKILKSLQIASICVDLEDNHVVSATAGVGTKLSNNSGMIEPEYSSEDTDDMPMEEQPSASQLLVQLTGACDKLHELRSNRSKGQKNNVLICCGGQHNLAAGVVAMHLMLTRRLTHVEAWQYLQSVRASLDTHRALHECMLMHERLMEEYTRCILQDQQLPAFACTCGMASFMTLRDIEGEDEIKLPKAFEKIDLCCPLCGSAEGSSFFVPSPDEIGYWKTQGQLSRYCYKCETEWIFCLASQMLPCK
eukprot:TRINITY_DN1382_c0_g1_i5.p1 TRINITY_DN1382_c0_g1~~TRINITY_DN1382_c0_g1_i5.p1  ORF type:complete len:2108 (-),score=712.08 TRINITY_DN1382_c0_g1_i5:1165-6846(-)